MTYNLIVSCPLTVWYILLASVATSKTSVGIKRSSMRKIDNRWVGGMGRIGLRDMALEKILAEANIDRMGRIVKLYKNPSRHSSAPNNVTYSSAQYRLEKGGTHLLDSKGDSEEIGYPLPFPIYNPPIPIFYPDLITQQVPHAQSFPIHILGFFLLFPNIRAFPFGGRSSPQSQTWTIPVQRDSTGRNGWSPQPPYPP
jgi:hypothetical protein